MHPARPATDTYISAHVPRVTVVSGFRHSLLYRGRLLLDGRIGLPEGAPCPDFHVQCLLVHWFHPCRGHHFRHPANPIKLGVADPVTTAGGSFCLAGFFHIVRFPPHSPLGPPSQGEALTISSSFIPESPRFLISRDRHEEALAVLVKYHAEGDANSEFARAEMAQIQSTIKIELDHSKQSWLDLVRTAGMRRRVIIASLLGLFTQWSGNTLISYYLDDLLSLMGFTDPQFKGKLNVGITCWNFVNGMTIALLVGRFRRRAMYMTCTISLLCVYVGWTISMERFLTTNALAAARLTIFFIFAYSPAYNIGYNALTYTYMVELFPYAQRARGLSLFQFWGRGAGFFTTFVNPIGLEKIEWKWLLTYCCWIAFEIVVVYLLFPETSGRTLEELAFRKCTFPLEISGQSYADQKPSVRRQAAGRRGDCSGREANPPRGYARKGRDSQSCRGCAVSVNVHVNDGSKNGKSASDILTSFAAPKLQKWYLDFET